MNRPMTRNEHMREAERVIEATRNHVYVNALRELRDVVFACSAVSEPRRIARDTVVREVERLIREAEEAE